MGHPVFMGLKQTVGLSAIYSIFIVFSCHFLTKTNNLIDNEKLRIDGYNKAKLNTDDDNLQLSLNRLKSCMIIMDVLTITVVIIEMPHLKTSFFS